MPRVIAKKTKKVSELNNKPFSLKVWQSGDNAWCGSAGCHCTMIIFPMELIFL